MLKISTRLRRFATSPSGSRTHVRPLRVAIISSLAAVVSVFALVAIASAHDVYTTNVYINGTTTCAAAVAGHNTTNSTPPQPKDVTLPADCSVSTTGTAITPATGTPYPVVSVSSFPASVYDTASVQNDTGTNSEAITYTLYQGAPSTTPGSSCPLAGNFPNGDSAKTTIPAGGTSQTIFADDSPSYPTYTHDNYTSGTSVSPTFTISTPGTYYFIAYTPYDDPSTGLNFTYGITCEPFTVSPLTPGLSTTPSVNGSTASDSATVTGTPTPSGKVTFTLFNSSNTQIGTPDTESINNAGVATTTENFGTLLSGSYYFVGVYSGDMTYSPLTGSHETLTISPPACTSGCGGGGGGSPTDSLSTTPDVTGLSATDVATVTGSAGIP